MIEDMVVQEKLASIRQMVNAQPARYDFSSYLEYFCGKEIGGFSDVEIERAAKKFILILEQIITRGNLAQELIHPSLPPDLLELSGGAAILGFCHITEDFLRDIRALPEKTYWAIWFCVEVLEHLATNNIAFTNSFVTVSESGQQLFHVPTDHLLSFLVTPVTTPHGSRMHIVELLEAKNNGSPNER